MRIGIINLMIVILCLLIQVKLCNKIDNKNDDRMWISKFFNDITFDVSEYEVLIKDILI